MRARDTVGAGAVMLALVLSIGWLLWPHAGGGDVRAARGTVVQAVLCGPSGTTDSLSVELFDGQVIPARLDGCGHQSGEVLNVEVPDPLPAGEVTARLAGTGVPTAAAGEKRLGAIGVGIAGFAGALLVWRLGNDRRVTHRRVGP